MRSISIYSLEKHNSPQEAAGTLICDFSAYLESTLGFVLHSGSNLLFVSLAIEKLPPYFQTIALRSQESVEGEFRVGNFRTFQRLKFNRWTEKKPDA